MREREKDEESMRIGKERESPGKTDVPKLYAYNECEHTVAMKPKQLITSFTVAKFLDCIIKIWSAGKLFCKVQQKIPITVCLNQKDKLFLRIYFS